MPGALEGQAEGNIDEDVYEAARAFTGWTVGNGEERHDHKFPLTGAFYYYDQWHDHYQKRILGREFKSHPDAMADGRAVLDMVAHHPATARHVCTKLCRWWVADDPPQSIVDKAVRAWNQHASASDQIARTISTILRSPEFEAQLGQKLKRPNHLLVSLVRVLNINLLPSTEWYWLLEQMGWRQFSWPTPTGHPDAAAYWLGTNMVLKRWNSIPSLLWMHLEEGNDSALSDVVNALPNLRMDTLLDFWSMRLMGSRLEGAARARVKAKAMEELEELPNEDWAWLAEHEPEALEHKLLQLVRLVALLPEFQKR